MCEKNPDQREDRCMRIFSHRDFVALGHSRVSLGVHNKIPDMLGNILYWLAYSSGIEWVFTGKLLRGNP